jgi:hypothetical protein
MSAIRKAMAQNPNLERIAETHFFIRPVILRSLRQHHLTAEAKKIVGTHDTFLEFWQSNFGDRFFDMTTMIRLGTAVESGLRQHHKDAGGSVHSGPFYQRLIDPTDLINTFQRDCNYDLTTNTAWNAVREIMVHRHLYAHRTGLVDQQYINHVRNVCGEDIRPQLAVMDYPNQEVYWFQPLNKLDQFIEDTRRFFQELP